MSLSSSSPSPLISYDLPINTKETRVFGYIRVSTKMQVDNQFIRTLVTDFPFIKVADIVKIMLVRGLSFRNGKLRPQNITRILINEKIRETQLPCVNYNDCFKSILSKHNITL